VPTDDKSGVAISYSLIWGGAASKVTLFGCLCRKRPSGRPCSSTEECPDHVPASGSKMPLLNLVGDREDLVGEAWPLLGVGARGSAPRPLDATSGDVLEGLIMERLDLLSKARGSESEERRPPELDDDANEFPWTLARGLSI